MMNTNAPLPTKLSPAQHSFRLSNMTGQHQSLYTNGLSSTPQSLASIAATLGVSPDVAEKRLSSLIDESLASRTVGSRTTATYTSL